VIVGTWRSRDDWHSWHAAPSFRETRAQLDGLVRGPEEHTWHDVVIEDGEGATAAPGRG